MTIHMNSDALAPPKPELLMIIHADYHRGARLKHFDHRPFPKPQFVEPPNRSGTSFDFFHPAHLSRLQVFQKNSVVIKGHCRCSVSKHSLSFGSSGKRPRWLGPSIPLFIENQFQSMIRASPRFFHLTETFFTLPTTSQFRLESG